MDKGASASQTGPSQVEPAPVSPLRASVPSAWPCGHDRTPVNVARVGKAGLRCRTCRKVTTREYNRRLRGYYERRSAGPDQMACDGCGSEMVQTRHDTWECSAACPLSQGEWPEYTKAAQSMMRRTAQAIEARRAATGTGAVHESPVGETDAPETSQAQP